MKMYRFLLLAFAVLFVASCAEDDFEGTTYPVDPYQSASDATLFTIDNVVNGFFDKVQPSTSFVEFTVTPAGGAAPSSADIQYSYNGSENKTIASVSSFPGTVNIQFTDLLADAGISESAVNVGDQVKFTLANVSGNYGSSRTLNVPVSCASNLGGTYPFVSTDLAATSTYAGPCPDMVTGEVTFTDQGGGTYLVSDLGFGQYESTCWSDGPATSSAATFTDVCGKITTGGADQYGLVYFWTITDVSGSDLSISWVNDYGDSGKTVISRPDGSDWPPIFTE